MNDTLAIQLFLEAGNPRLAWDAMDDRDRYPWRKRALEEVADPAIHRLPAARQQRPLSSDSQIIKSESKGQRKYAPDR